MKVKSEIKGKKAEKKAVKVVKGAEKVVKVKKASPLQYVSGKKFIAPDGWKVPASHVFMGYCPTCYGILGSLDVPEGKVGVVNCYRCEELVCIEKLLKVRPIEEGRESFKDRSERIKALETGYYQELGPLSEVPEDLLPNLQDQMDLPS